MKELSPKTKPMKNGKSSCEPNARVGRAFFVFVIYRNGYILIGPLGKIVSRND